MFPIFPTPIIKTFIEIKETRYNSSYKNIVKPICVKRLSDNTPLPSIPFPLFQYRTCTVVNNLGRKPCLVELLILFNI